MSDEPRRWTIWQDQGRHHEPMLFYWLGVEEKAEQEWHDLLAMVRCDLECTEPSDWP